MTLTPADEFTAYVAAQQTALLRFAVVLCGDRHLAEELVADVLVKVYERWPSVAAADHRHAYVRRMLANHYVSWQRKWGRLRPEADVAVDLPVPDRSHEHAERDALVTGLRRLPRQQRAVIVLHFYEGLAAEEIAEVLGCRPGTVRSHLSRGLASLRIDYVRQESTDA
ncbi:MAG: SigE family RNA polymerase sigma factor [Actinobacteria bacterium]|nr:SigE family RNA polymerase sigma factor [Actinomycetota bacterium]